MKKLKLLAVLAILFSFTSLSAKEFDWSECWCNYGGGISKGDLILNVDGALCFSDLKYSGYNGFWFIPPVMVELQYAQPIWKLPFTYGGYAGTRLFGTGSYTYFGLFFGGEIAYHMMLPPSGLDLYAVTRLGCELPFVWVRGWEWFGFHLGLGMGANWFFNDVFGVNFEIGYPFTKVGVSFKF